MKLYLLLPSIYKVKCYKAVIILDWNYFQVALDREEKDEYNVLIAAGRRGVIRGKEILAVNLMKVSSNYNVHFAKQWKTTCRKEFEIPCLYKDKSRCPAKRLCCLRVL